MVGTRLLYGAEDVVLEKRSVRILGSRSKEIVQVAKKGLAHPSPHFLVGRSEHHHVGLPFSSSSSKRVFQSC